MSIEHFNPHEASRTYASAAAVLAGFCFAAVVLILTFHQAAIKALLAADEGVFDRSVGALVTAFIGLVISAFLMARLGARPEPRLQNLWLGLLAAVGLVTSALFALWGLAELIGLVLPRADVLSLVRWVFVITSFLASAFVVAAAFDLRAVLITSRERRREAGFLVGAACIGGPSVCVLGMLLAQVDTNELVATPIDLIAKIQLVVFAVLLLTSLVLSSSAGVADTWRAGTVRTYVLVTLAPAVALTLFLKLHAEPPRATAARQCCAHVDVGRSPDHGRAIQVAQLVYEHRP